ncbi:TonB-dependent receptor plug domain-containing protein [Massilia aerilata]|uniref:TonB-dependent receptor plug domain-containing protein n=1 Tax=Massilia aerilata TaxID=453817 RepID=A0ABW0S3Z6_9BURK
MWELAGVAVVTATAPAVARTFPVADDQALRTVETAPALQSVQVKGSIDSYDPRRDDVASRIVIKREDIDRYGDATLADVLRRAPGVTVAGSFVQLRGLGNGYTQLLLNGERAPAGFTIDSIAPETIERIEILRTATADMSTQGIAGSINIVQMRAVSKARRELKLGAGKSQGMGEGKATLLLSDRDGGFSYAVPLSFSRNTYRRPVVTDEWDRGAGGVLNYEYVTRRSDDGDYALFNMAPSLNWTLANGDTLSFQSFFNASRNRYGNRNLTAYLAGMAPVDPMVDTGLRNLNLLFRTDVSWTHKLGDGRKLETRLAGSAGNIEQETSQQNFAADGDPTFARKVNTLLHDRGVTSIGKYSAPVGEDHVFATGWDTGLASNGTGRDQIESAIPSHERYRARVERLALYGQDEWRLNALLSLSLGGRWETVRTRTSGDGLAGSASRSNVLSPLLHALVKIPGTKSDQVRLALTRTYKAPETGQLVPRRSLAIFNSSTSPDYMGDPGLRPELATGLDASWEHDWDKGSRLSLSGSTRRIADRVVQTVMLEEGRWVARPRNAGHALVHTLELETRFPLRSVFAAAPALDVRASASRNWSRVDDLPGPDNRLAQQAPFSSTFGLDYRAGALSMGGTVTYRAASKSRVSLHEWTYDSRRSDIDLYALWQIAPEYKLRLAASNFLQQDWLSDHTYRDVQGSHHTTAAYSGKAWGRATLEMSF